MAISSRTEPPGWMIAVTPRSPASWMASANGKYASDASADWEARSDARWSAISTAVFPTLAEQLSPTWLGGGANGAAAKALTQQANFLKEQGRLQTVAPDYSKNVTVEWVTKAM